MKRFAICALVFLVGAGVANAQEAKLWIQAPGGGNEVCVGISETAVIELWMEVYAINLGPYVGRLVAMDAILTHTDSTSTAGTGNFDVSGFTDYGNWGTFGRKDPRGLITVPGGDLNDYQFLGVDENQPFSLASGLGPGTYHLDDIIIHGMTQTQDLPCPPVDTATADKVLFSYSAPPGGFFIVPTYGPTNGYYDATFVFGTGENNFGKFNDQPLFVGVTPEPSSLSLLLLGGLAAFRRR